MDLAFDDIFISEIGTLDLGPDGPVKNFYELKFHIATVFWAFDELPERFRDFGLGKCFFQDCVILGSTCIFRGLFWSVRSFNVLDQSTILITLFS